MLLVGGGGVRYYSWCCVLCSGACVCCWGQWKVHTVLWRGCGSMVCAVRAVCPDPSVQQLENGSERRGGMDVNVLKTV